MPSLCRRPSSSSTPGFGVVNSFSPTKMEFAPARKHRVTASGDSCFRPAASRTLRTWHENSSRGDRPHHFKRVKRRTCRKRCPFDAHEHINRPSHGGILRHSDHVLRIEQSLTLYICLIMRALWAIRAVLRAAPGLDRNQLAGLHAIRWMESAVHGLCSMYQFRKGCLINLLHFALLPVVTHCATCAGRRSRNSIFAHHPFARLLVLTLNR